MNFFHLWAKDIAAGDWLTNKSLHPYHSWHAALAFQAYQRQGGENYSQAIGREIWSKWYGGKRFHQEPLYAYFLAVIYKFLGDNVRIVFILQLLLGILNNALIYLITRRHFGASVALLAAAIAVCYGPFIYYESVLLRPTLVIFTMLIAGWLLGIAFERKRYIYFWLSGLAIGFCFLAKSTISLFFLLLISFLLYYYRKNLKQGFGYLGFLILGFFIALFPLMLRNLIVGVAPLEVSSVGAVTFINSNAGDAPVGAGFYLSSYAADILNKTQGKFIPSIYETLRIHPDIHSYLKQLCGKFFTFWNWYEIPDNTDYYYYRLYSSLLAHWQLTFFTLGCLSFFGLISALPTFNKSFILYFLVICGILVNLIFYSLSRFRVLIVPILIPFAAYFIVFIIKQILARKYLLLILILAMLVTFGNLFFLSLPIDGELIRTAGYYIVGNSYCIKRANELMRRGDLQAALKIVELGLKTEPVEILNITSVPAGIKPDKDLRSLADSFREMHWLCSQLNKEIPNMEKAKYHYDRSAILYQYANGT